MAYYDHDNRQYQRPRYDSYSRHADDKLTAMSSRVNHKDSYPCSSYEPRYAARAERPSPPLPRRSAAAPARSRYTWPPSPSVEDERASLAREHPSSPAAPEETSGGEGISRGSVDQYPIIEEIPQPEADNDERRYVLVSDPGADDGTNSTSSKPSGSRRKSFAERGNMAHLETDVDDPPLFTKRTSTPYAFTKSQKESVGPPGDYFLSPEPVTPSTTSVPRSVPTRDGDQNSRPSKSSTPAHSRYDSFAQSPRTPKTDVFDDSDADSDDATHLRTERKPARYSFVKSELQKEDLRTNLLGSQTRSEQRK
ncbi:hypothetical protein BDV95DRAFT_507332, partial [Massariosphaeria phaeospora]